MTTASGFRVIGTRPIRHDGVDKVTGRAIYGADLQIAGLLHGRILRSPHPHARIRGIDATRALALPGVLGVVTGAELARMVGPIPSVVRAPVPYFPFAIDRVRHVGEAVAVAVADTRYIAEDACELIE